MSLDPWMSEWGNPAGWRPVTDFVGANVGN